jgi:hypothetical protein
MKMKERELLPAVYVKSRAEYEETQPFFEGMAIQQPLTEPSINTQAATLIYKLSFL